MAYILHIESTSTVCSVALSNDTELKAFKELNNGYTHAENLHVFIKEVLDVAGISPAQLSAVSVSSGPGSYTGLRIGFSAAKGLAYALKIPLIVVGTLKVLTSQIEKSNTDALYCPMLDARRMEVYTALYTQELYELTAPNALVLTEESIISFNTDKPVYFFGEGMPKARALLQTLPNAHFIDEILPGAKAMINFAYNQFLNKEFADTAYAEPFYLKEFFFTVSKK